MKKWLFLLTVLLGSFSIVSMVHAQTNPAQAAVTASRLNVRSGPSTAFSIIASIRQGETYPIIGRNTDRSWWQISTESVDGWISARYVTAVNTSNVPVTLPDCVAYIAPECPDSQIFARVSMQPFENGVMLWRSDVPEILVLFDDGRFLNYFDSWNGQALTQETPPPGLYQPQFGFGLVWTNHPEVRGSLGWATSGEAYYNTAIETVNGTTASTQTIYLQLENARVVALNYYADRWTYLS